MARQSVTPKGKKGLDTDPVYLLARIEGWDVNVGVSVPWMDDSKRQFDETYHLQIYTSIVSPSRMPYKLPNELRIWLFGEPDFNMVENRPKATAVGSYTASEIIDITAGLHVSMMQTLMQLLGSSSVPWLLVSLWPPFRRKGLVRSFTFERACSYEDWPDLMIRRTGRGDLDP